MNDYRGDDQTTGQCPKCGRDLGHLTVGLRGWCEQHGWTFANFRSGMPPDAVSAFWDAVRETSGYGDPGDEQVEPQLIWYQGRYVCPDCYSTDGHTPECRYVVPASGNNPKEG